MFCVFSWLGIHKFRHRPFKFHCYVKKLTYKSKYFTCDKYLTDEYHLSDKAIEKILREARDLDVPWD